MIGFITETMSIAQETESSRQLERIDIEAPQRRPASRATTSSRTGAGYDEPAPSDSMSSENRGALEAALRSNIPSSTLSVVEGKSGVSLGAQSLPSQVNIVTAQDIQRLNIQTYTDLFRKIPGMKAFTWGQGDLGSPIQMRGFGSNNGSDVCIFVDGVPQAFPSLAAGVNSTSELYWIAPELIEKIEVIKGPFSALYGDWALAGAINIITKKSQASPSVNLLGGSFGNFRALGILSRETWAITPYLAYEYYTIDGYRDNSQMRRVSPFNKFSLPILGGILSLRYNYYNSTTGAPGYIRIDQVKSGLISRRDAVNVTDGGDRSRHELVMNYSPMCGERGLYAALYLGYLDRKRWYTFPANPMPTYPSSGQLDHRLYWGGRVYYNLVFGEVANLTIGGETRQDSGPSQQFNQNNRQWISDQFNYGVRLSNWAGFLQGQIKPADTLKFVGGVRTDYFVIDVENLVRPANSGIGYPSIISPKIGVVFTPLKDFNIFGNVGSGFRSPMVQEVSPYAAGKTKNFFFQPPVLTSADVGFNALLFGSLYLSLEYYHTINSNEIRTINSQPVNLGTTVRKGYEGEIKYYPSSDVNVFANYAWVDARVVDPTNPGQVLIPTISEHLIKGGVEFQKDFGQSRRLLMDAYYQYNSGAPAYYKTNPSPVWGRDYDVYNFKLSYEGMGWSSWISAQYCPREFSADYTGTFSDVTKAHSTFNPPAKWTFASGLTYTFQ
jgi:outer membrane receptor protein involved in Fe transport